MTITLIVTITIFALLFGPIAYFIWQMVQADRLIADINKNLDEARERSERLIIGYEDEDKS